MQEPTRQPMPGNLLATKFFVPPFGEGWISRPRLLERLSAGLACPLTLISAPAGFGKSSVLAEWVQHMAALRGATRPAIAWLSLDVADNDPARFLSYVIAALQKVVPGVANDLVAPLRSPQPPAVEAIVTVLVNELTSVAYPLALILDDYHVITSAAVNGVLTFLLENLPPNLHLVISTRFDPPIPIARLRSRGQVVEIRSDDLRFTPDEADVFLRQSMGLTLSSEQVAALDERVEGWIAGLQMAAISMRGREDVDSFIRAFAGTNRFIMDFMLEEVLAREPEEIQAFLLQTAILNRLTGSLCDAVTGTSGGQAMLERLERRNLFVVPLDDDRRWYRYHHLLADLLQARLYQSGPDPAARLQLRAVEWCERHGQAADAVGYALAAKDYGRAAGLIANYWPHAVADGEVQTVWYWLSALPEDTIRNSAPLGVAYCWLLWFRGQICAIEEHLVVAERAMNEWTGHQGSGADDEGYTVVSTLVATLRSVVARFHDDFDAAIEYADRALGLLSDHLPPLVDAQLRTLIWLTLASAYGGAGDLERAVYACAETIRWSRLGRSASGLAGATYWMTNMLRLLGRLRRAGEACRDAIRFVEEQGMARLPAAGLLHVLMSEVLLERNDLEAAESSLARGAELGRWSGRLDAVRNAARALVRLRLARHDPGGAFAAVQEAEAALGEPPSPLPKAELLALRAGILVRQGALRQAQQCVEEAVHLAGHDRGQSGDAVALAACRMRLAQNKPDAIAELSRSLAAAEGSGRSGTAMEMRILRSLALARQGDMRVAEDDLERALALAEPEGYVRLFVDEGEPMADLLRGLAIRPTRTSESGGYSAQYVATLLSAFEPDSNGLPSKGVGRTDGRPQTGRSSTLIEPLSEREREVLRLMAEGLTNEQIAARLIIALGTVKAHSHNIFGKLGAQNRAHAVARAKELGLL